ncbi:hypothetical protein ODV21_09745 [Lactobacillus amylovorus]|uniref:hypothetical protein n=1 Tax=Lactobacillus amylovorus TaxID=1604 RepID=UPI0023312A90|nr:hypothetical protein [Lactobacillus amylovorus]MDB6243850.1 hypothetical protein [Lactobacillus amylovorus]
MTQKDGLRKLYDQFFFIARQPLKINTALFVDLVLIFLSIIELDAYFNGILTGFFAVCLILNVACVIASVVYIANLPDRPNSLYDIKFSYRRSLNSTRELQKLLVQNVDSIGFPTARKQSQINNNLIRYESFVLVFERYGYIFIRQTQKIDSRRDREVYDNAAEEISVSLGMRRSTFQNLVVERFWGAGQIKLEHFLVMRISK